MSKVDYLNKMYPLLLLLLKITLLLLYVLTLLLLNYLYYSFVHSFSFISRTMDPKHNKSKSQNNSGAIKHIIPHFLGLERLTTRKFILYNVF